MKVHKVVGSLFGRMGFQQSRVIVTVASYKEFTRDTRLKGQEGSGRSVSSYLRPARPEE